MYTSKHALRAHYKSLRAEYVQEHGKANFHDPLLALLHEIGFLEGVIGLYLPIGYEADISSIMTDPTFSKYTFAIPKISKEEKMVFVTYHPGQTSLTESSFGFMEPEHGDHVVPSLVLAPLVAFDKEGNRLGYGKGHFDDYIESHRQKHSFIYTGIAYAVQKSPEILPTHEGDQKLDAVVLPNAYILFKPL